MKPCVFGIDDAHWIDPDSWLFLLDLVREPNAILIFTMRPLETIVKKPQALIEILDHPSTKVLQLDGLSPEHTVELTCQLLGVASIPEQLKEIIHAKSHGVPLWCEELVETMLELDYLRIEEDKGSEERSEGKKRGKSVFLHKLGEKSGSTTSFTGEIGADDIPIPDSVTGMVLARIDHMSASEQMTLKCAAVIGTCFTRTMLQAIIPNCNAAVFHDSLNTLAEAGIIECAVAAEKKRLLSEETSEESKENAVSRLDCLCLEEEIIEQHLPIIAATPTQRYHHASSFPVVKECENLQFVHNYIQETAYNLCTESQRKKLHESAAHFLESQAHKCKNCGGGDFIGGRNHEVKKRKNISRKAYHGVGSLQGRDRLLSMQGSEVSASISGAAGGYRKGSNMSDDGGRKLSVRSFRPSNSSLILEVNMEECHCDEVLAKVYPQLVRHWRAAGDLHNTMIYLIEEASAALATFNNMEAMSLLEEAKGIIDELGETSITDQEHGRLQGLIGQVCTVRVHSFFTS